MVPNNKCIQIKKEHLDLSSEDESLVIPFSSADFFLLPHDFGLAVARSMI
jgi:hypothetical protein